MSDKPSKNDEKGMYFKSYKMYEHNGTIEGHKKWRRAGAVYFEAKKRLLVLSLILTGAFDPTPLITTWPFEPENWKPTIEGKIPKAEALKESLREKKKQSTYVGEAEEIAEIIKTKETQKNENKTSNAAQIEIGDDGSNVEVEKSFSKSY